MRIAVESLTKRFGPLAAVNDVSLSIEDGEMFTLLGPSGCGKTTLLRLLAGFYTPDAGAISFGERVVNNVPAHERGIGMVFQNYALWPHMTVAQNVAYGLKLRKIAASQTSKRVDAVLEQVGLTGLAHRYPGQLSGGQQQRVALARALVLNPHILLLDEPLSNLDAKIRVQVRAEIRKIQKELGITAVYVTHDQEEALTLGARVAVMRAGRIEQVAPPLEMYRRPANTFVAQFVGTPAMNFLPAEAFGSDLPQGAIAGVRPQDVVLGASGRLPGTVALVEPRGHDCLVHLRLDMTGEPVLVAVTDVADMPTAGNRLAADAPVDRLHLFDAKDGRRL